MWVLRLHRCGWFQRSFRLSMLNGFVFSSPDENLSMFVDLARFNTLSPTAVSDCERGSLDSWTRLLSPLPWRQAPIEPGLTSHWRCSCEWPWTSDHQSPAECCNHKSVPPCLVYAILRVEPWTSWLLGKHSPSELLPATSSIPFYQSQFIKFHLTSRSGFYVPASPHDSLLPCCGVRFGTGLLCSVPRGGTGDLEMRAAALACLVIVTLHCHYYIVLVTTALPADTQLRAPENCTN